MSTDRARPDGEGPDQVRIAELAGGLRTAVTRLAHALGSPAADRGVTPTRLTALFTLERHGPLRPGDLATRLKVTPASMSRLAEALEQGRWVTRTPDPADRRAYLLDLSDHGVATLEGLRRDNHSELAADISTLTEPERTALAAALPVLSALADRHRRA